MSAARVVSRVEDKVRLGPDAQVDVVCGPRRGDHRPCGQQHPIQGAVVTLDPGAFIDYEVPGGASSLRVSAADGDRPARVLSYSGTPLRETVVMGGPFVMNSRAEIERAYQDFHSGRFGQVPRLARLKRT